MAALTEICFLLFAVINNIHAEELITVKEERESYTFVLPKEADSCLISKFVGEEKLVLWNTSDLWSDNSTVPEDLKRRLSVISTENNSSHMIHHLTQSDSGLYQEECWTDGKVTYEKSSSVIICSLIYEMNMFPVKPGTTENLNCYKETDDLDVLWLQRDFRYEQTGWTRVFGDNTTLVMDEGRFQVVKNTSALQISNLTTTAIREYTCLVMDQQQCVSSQPVEVYLFNDMIYRSVGETAVFRCPVTDFSDDQPPRWKSYTEQKNLSMVSVDQNYSLVISSLTLNDTGVYECEISMRDYGRYFMIVCPKFSPPAVELFSEGEEVTLGCKDAKMGDMCLWFFKSIQTKGRIVSIQSNLTMNSRSILPDGCLVISNISLKDKGEYWCAVLEPDGQCITTSKTVLMYRDPFGIHSTFYKVRCSLLSGLLVMLCVVVVAVNQRTRGREQL